EALARAEMGVARAGPRPVGDPAVMAGIPEAVMSMCAVRFRYHGGSTAGRLRTIAPWGLLYERMNYLVGAEAGKQEPRNWRLDRISDIELTDMPAAPPNDFSLADYAGRSFGVYQDEVEDVVLRVLPHGAEDARAWRFHADQTLETLPDGAVIVRFRSGGMLELAWHLFTWGDRIEILGPERLKAAMRGALATAMARHGGSPTVSVG